MKINYSTAMQLWENYFDNAMYAEDFHGSLMYRDAYGDNGFIVIDNGRRIYCGWNIHHILPKKFGGNNAIENLICTNIITNELAGNKTTYWIDDCLYQVRKIFESHIYEIVQIN